MAIAFPKVLPLRRCHIRFRQPLFKDYPPFPSHKLVIPPHSLLKIYSIRRPFQLFVFPHLSHLLSTTFPPLCPPLSRLKLNDITTLGLHSKLGGPPPLLPTFPNAPPPLFFPPPPIPLHCFFFSHPKRLFSTTLNPCPVLPVSRIAIKDFASDKSPLASHPTLDTPIRYLVSFLSALPKNAAPKNSSNS